jgi:hypothetical protein
MHNYPMNKNSARDFGTALKRLGFTGKRTSKATIYATVSLPESAPEQTSSRKSNSGNEPPADQDGLFDEGAANSVMAQNEDIHALDE